MSCAISCRAERDVGYRGTACVARVRTTRGLENTIHFARTQSHPIVSAERERKATRIILRVLPLLVAQTITDEVILITHKAKQAHQTLKGSPGIPLATLLDGQLPAIAICESEFEKDSVLLVWSRRGHSAYVRPLHENPIRETHERREHSTRTTTKRNRAWRRRMTFLCCNGTVLSRRQPRAA